MKNLVCRQLIKRLAYLLALVFVSPSAGAEVVSAGQGLCTHVYLPDDAAVTGIEVSLLVNGATTAAAHWGGHSPSEPASRYVGDAPPSDGAWHKLVVDLATGLSSPVAAGDDISDIVWVMHRNVGIREVWSETCLAEESEIPPVITLLGDNPLLLEQFTAFTDPGSECVDNVDGPCTATVDASAIDPNILGDYEVIYSATDSDGNRAQAIRVVSVVLEDLPPVITVLGDDPIEITVGSAYVDPVPAYSCLDERYDGDCTSAVVVDISGVDTNRLGTHQVVYSVTDSKGHPAQATRDVRVRYERRLEAEHATNPSLHMQTWNNPNASNGQQMQWAPGEPWGMLIWDVEVDVTSTYELQFAIACSGNSSPCTARKRDVIVNGVLVGQISFASTGGWSVFKEFEIATTLNAGNNTVQFSTPADSTLTGPHVDYLDLVFDEDAEWQNVQPPVITLAETGPINIPLGGTFTLPDYTCIDDVDGDCTDDVVVNGTVNEDVEGTYVITFDATDSAGNVAEQVTLGVVVADPTPPVITLLGDNPLVIEQGTPFVDPGSLCTDNIDGACTAAVDASAVDTSTLGDYTVYYSATDSDGNSTEVTRTVSVIELDTPPVITVLGDNPVEITIGSEYVDPVPGYSCLDELYDGDCTASVVVDLSGVDTGVLGTQQVVYSVTDSRGQPAMATRDVRVRFERRLEAEDATNPSLHMQTWNNPGASGGKQMQWAPGEPWGMLIWDVEVDVTSTYELQFAIACSGNSSPCTARKRDVIVNGVLIGQISFASTGGWSVFKEFEIAATLEAGNNTVQFSTPSDSTLTGPHVDYLDVVFDEDAEWQNVHPPVITLADPGPINIPLGGSFTLPDYTCVDDVDGDCTDDVAVGGDTVQVDSSGTYNITFDATDDAGNVAGQVVLSVVVEGFTLGSLTRSIWLGIGGKPVSSLTGNAAYPDSPTSVGPITTFESQPPGDSYGQRIQGYLHPTVGGDYTFFIASDDASQLWLSTDSSAHNATKIAEVPGSNWTGFRQWTKFAQQTSETITLAAGEVYYIEALHKEGSGGEHVSVAWQGPGIAQEIIPGSVLSPLIDINEPPDLQLKGAATQNVLSGTSYTDPGFTCVDDFDGDCTADVVVGGDVVNPAVDDTYVITYDVADGDGNVTPTVTRTVVVGPPVLGSITREKWNGLNSGAKVSTLTSHPNYPDNPSIVDTITAFDSQPGGTTYGQRVHGYLHPTVDGEYTFWIASDESSQLWLNTSGTDQVNITKIAEVHFINFTGYQEWDKFPQQQSVTITLTAGQAYYIRALHKQAWGSEHMEVAWEGPGISQQIIPGSVLSPMP